MRRGEGMLIRPTFSIHTMFVRFPIDVVFLDRDMTVVSISHDLKPWRFAAARKAKSASSSRPANAGGSASSRRPARMGEGLMGSVAETSTSVYPSSTRAFRPIAVPPGLVAVAAITAGAAALIKFDLSARAFVAAFFAAVLVVLAAIDLEQRVIPNRIVVPAGIAAFLGDIIAEPHRWKEWTTAAFAAFFIALAVFFCTGGGVGMGDVKLAFLLGAGLGWAVAETAQWRRWRRSSSPSGSSPGTV